MTRIPDSHRGRSDNFAAAMRRSAEARRCPACKRKSALKHEVTEYVSAYVCRWCGFERGYDFTTGIRW